MKVVVLILLSLILVLDARAIAVASDYLEENKLLLIEETSAIYSIRLQNPDNFEVKFKIDYNPQYMEAIDLKEEYILEPKSKQRIEFNVTAPGYEKGSDNLYDISYTVKQLSGAGGGIGFLPSISKQIKLEVIRDPDRFHISIYHIIGAVVLLSIVFYIYMKSNSGKTKPAQITIPVKKIKPVKKRKFKRKAKL